MKKIHFCLISVIIFNLLLLAHRPVWSYKYKLSIFIKRFGIVRFPEIKIKEKPTETSKVIANELFGKWVIIKTKINPVREKKLANLGKWIKISTSKKISGYVKTDSLLLLDLRQKKLWQRNYTRFKIKKNNVPYFRVFNKAHPFFEKNFNSSNLKIGYLKKGCVLWAEERKSKYLIFRDLRKSPYYNQMYVSIKNAKKSR